MLRPMPPNSANEKEEGKMFGRTTKKQLHEALRIANASFELTDAAFNLVDVANEGNRQARELVDKANAMAEDWRRMYREATQSKPNEAPHAQALELNPPHCSWVN